MKKIIIGIFAHPDDEAFGVSPTLIKEVAEGASVHLVTLTAGETGSNPDKHDDLGAIRLDEWRKSCEIIGASSSHYFGYRDGALGNTDMVEVTERIEQLVRSIVDSTDAPIECMSFDMNGISGHIDHIVAARATALAFYRLKAVFPERITRLRLRCVSAQQSPEHNIDWLYMDAGRPSDMISETIDARAHHETVVRVIKAHRSQRKDGETHIARYGKNIGINHFIVYR